MKDLKPEQPDLADVPIYVDLDGTLLRTDVAQELLLRAFGHWPDLRRLPGAALAGRAQLKSDLASWHDITPETLPYNEDLLTYLRREKAAGRQIVLATAADRKVAEPIAAHLGLFDRVIASDEGRNLKGAAKLAAIREDTDAGFEYIGDSAADRPIWDQAHFAGYVDAATRIRSPRVPVSVDLSTKPARWQAVLRAMRPHQWAKNALIFLPLFFSHTYSDPALAGRAWVTFGLFCLIASSIYILNDLSDIEADRAHPRKKLRPFAAGDLMPVDGVLVALGLLAIALGISQWALGTAMTLVFLLYVAVTTLYSLWLKNVAVVDVVTLTCLYTLRIFAGGVAIGFLPSVWLLNFSLFFFLSLALMKRFIELARLRDMGLSQSRGYTVDDLDAILPMGTATGGLAVLTLTLYLNSDFVEATYASPRLLWGIAPLTLFWIFRAWLKAKRGLIGHDPVVFALRDRISLVTIGLCGVLVIAAHYLQFASFAS